MLKKQKATKFFKPSALYLSKKKKRVDAARAQVETREVAVWDIDAHSGYLNRVLDTMNRRQRLFKFTLIEATAPTGLTISGDRTREIAKQYGADIDSPEIGQNILAEDIYRAARPILESFGSDLLVCVVSPMIMDYLTQEEDGKTGLGWDYFSVSKGGIVLVSAFGLRDYAEQAERPFEACLAALIAAQVFVESFPMVGIHDEGDTRGCLMDYCENRADVVLGLRSIGICDDTKNEIPDDARASALKILDAIREYKT
jgi:hypothetical protein